MSDIISGLGIILASSVGLFWLGVAISRRGTKHLCTAIGLMTTAFLLWFAVAVHGTLTVARILPASNAIVLGNLIPLGASLLAGLVVGNPAIPRWRSLVVAAMLIYPAWQTEFSQLPDSTPTAIDRWSMDRVCLQTTPSSCSACSAVMLLRSCGIRSDESEMIRLCWTGQKGTPPLGLYRGLRLKTKGTPWKVEVVGPRMKDLESPSPLPVLVFIDLPSRDDLAGHLARNASGERSQHCVVLYGWTDNGQALVGDPAQGLRRWTRDKLESHWTGDGLRLTRSR